VDTRLLDQLVDQVGELITVKGSLLEETRGGASPGLREAVQRVERLVGSLQRQALKLRMMPFEMIADRFPRAVRDLARKESKEVEFRLEGREIELDRSILDHLSDPLLHLLRNAVDHGIEPPEERAHLGKTRAGTLTLRVAREGESIYLQIADDGRGMDPAHLRRAAVRRGVLTAEQAADLSDEEALELITRPGFSTADQVTDVSGRGVGMDVVKTVIEGLHGSLLIASAPGEGTTFTLRLPVSLAVISALLVRVGPERYAIPMYQVGTTIEVLEEEIQRAQGQEVAGIGGEFFHADVFEMAAAYLYHIARNHPFVDGNKRMGVAATLDFLYLNDEIVLGPFSAVLPPLDRIPAGGTPLKFELVLNQQG